MEETEELAPKATKKGAKIREVEKYLEERRWLSVQLGVVAACGAFIAWLFPPMARMLFLIPFGMGAVAGLFAGVILLDKAQRSQKQETFVPLLGACLCAVCLLKVTGMAVWNAVSSGASPPVLAQQTPPRVQPAPQVPPAVVPNPAPANPPAKPATPAANPPQKAPPTTPAPPVKRVEPAKQEPAPPAAGPGIAPVAFPLPGKLLACAVGGGGRYLVLQTQFPNQLILFDVKTRRLVRSLELANPTILFAAGYDHLVVLDRYERLIHRYKLETLERELSEILSFKSMPTHLAMGSASSDIVLVAAANENRNSSESSEFQLLDLNTFKNLGYTISGAPALRHNARITASADGQVFACARVSLPRSPRNQDANACTLIPSGNQLECYVGTLNGDLAPDYRGRWIYHGAARSNRWGERVTSVSPREVITAIPGVDGPFEIRLSLAPRDAQAAAAGREATIHWQRSETPLATLRGIQMDRRQVSTGSIDTLPLADQLLWIAEYGLLINLVTLKTEMLLYDVPTDEMLAKVPKEPMYLSAPPRPRAELQKPYAERLRVRSSKGAAKFRLESGPPGLTLSPEGEVAWKPTEDGAHHVVFSAVDPAGQTLVDSFPILVGPRTPWVTTNRAEINPRNLRELNWGAMQSTALALGREVRPPGVTAAQLASDPLRLELPGTLRDVTVGGAGRYLFLEFTELDVFAVFDVSQAKIVRYLNLGRRPVVAACIDKLIVADNDRRELSRWDLHTFEREQVIPLPPEVVVHALAMGCASNGPALLGFAEMAPPILIDVETLKRLDAQPTSPNRFDCGPGSRIRASANGRLFAASKTHVTPSGVGLLQLEARGYSIYSAHASAGALLPTPDGRMVTTSGVPYTNNAVQNSVVPWRGNLPSVQGPYLLESSGDTALIFAAGSDRVLQQLDELDGLRVDSKEFDRETFTRDKRLFLVPAAKLLVSVVKSRDALVLRKADPDQAVESIGLYISSLPRPLVLPGELWRYQLTAQTKFPPVEFKLVTGPQGMKITSEGEATWQGPATYDPRSNPLPVEIEAQDASGAKTKQSFQITPTFKL